MPLAYSPIEHSSYQNPLFISQFQKTLTYLTMAPPAKNIISLKEELPPDLTESSGSGSDTDTEDRSHNSEDSSGNADDWDGIDASDTSGNETEDGSSDDEDEEILERGIAQGNIFFKNRQWSKAEAAFEDAINIIKSRDLEEGEVMILKILPSLLMCYLSLKKFGSAIELVASVVENPNSFGQISDPKSLLWTISMSLLGFTEYRPALLDARITEKIELGAIYFSVKAKSSDNDHDVNALICDAGLDLIKSKMGKRKEFYEELSPISKIDLKSTAAEIRKLKFEDSRSEAFYELVQPSSKLKKMNSTRMVKRALIAFKAQKYDIATRYFKMADVEFAEKRDKDAAILTKYAIAKSFWCRDTDSKNPEEIIDMLKAITTLKEGKSFAPALLEQSKLYYENKMLAEAERLLHACTLVVRSKGYVATRYTVDLCSVFPELDPTELERRLDKHRDILHRHPEPLAICRYEHCTHLPPHNTNPIRREIFADDPGFKCFYELICTEKCSVTLHQACWKVYKDNRGSANASERELLTSQCLTPDCKGPIAKIMKKEKDKVNPVKTWEADSESLFAAVQRTSGAKIYPINYVKEASTKPSQVSAEKLIPKGTVESQNEHKKQVFEHKITGSPLNRINETPLNSVPDVRIGGSIIKTKSSVEFLQDKEMAGNSLGARSKVPSLAVKSFQEATNNTETLDVAKKDQMLCSKENMPSHMGDKVITNEGRLSQQMTLQANAHLVDKIGASENAHVGSNQLVLEQDMHERSPSLKFYPSVQENVGIFNSNSPSIKEKELAQEVSYFCLLHMLR